MIHVQCNFVESVICNFNKSVDRLNVHFPKFRGGSHPEIGDSSFSCALLTVKQQLKLKVRSHCGICIVLL